MAGIPPTMRLQVPADPPLVITARVFVAAGARALGLDEELIEDLRLATSELFSSAVEREAAAVTLSLAGAEEGWTLTIQEQQALAPHPADELPIGRLELVRALFPDLRHDGDVIVIDERSRAGGF